MHQLNIALLVLGGSALILGLLSKPLKRAGLPDSVVLLCLGILLGPLGFGLMTPHTWGGPMLVLEQAARLALAIGLMGVALQLPKPFIPHHWRSVGAVLLVAMPFMWLAGSGLVGWLLGLPLGAALLIGAVVTPTDPVVASSVVTGPVAQETLPAHLRQLISAEAGANDGLAYLFVLIPIFLLTSSPGESLAYHIATVLFGDVLSAILLGGVIGYCAGTALHWAERVKAIEKPSVLMFTTALALATLAAVDLLGSEGILAVFVAGLAFDQKVNVKERHEEERVVEGVDRFFTSPIFVLLGLMIPWREWLELGWQALVLIVAILLLRRLPILLLLGGRLKDLPGFADSLFAGWFGPLGVAALYYAALAHHQTHLPEVWPVVSLLVVSSIFAHGLTATPFSRWYARRGISAD